jgi:hypothetical protein
MKKVILSVVLILLLGAWIFLFNETTSGEINIEGIKAQIQANTNNGTLKNNIALYNELIQFDTSCLDYYKGLADTYLQLDKTADYISTLNNIRTQFPDDVYGHVALFEYYYSINDGQNILSIYNELPDKIKSIDIKLPIKTDGSIDFDFMESIISELQAEHIAELENYLLAAGLKDCNLTEQEQKILYEYDKIEWGKFKLGTLFERMKTNKLPFKADNLPKQMTSECTLPCLTSSFI